MKKFTIILLLFLPYISIANFKIENNREILAKNQVKALEKRTCFGSCMGESSRFDRRGNTIEWDFWRTASYYQYKYDKNNRQIAAYAIDKSDGTKEDASKYHTKEPVYLMVEYDENKNITYKQTAYTEIFLCYDKANNLTEELRLNSDKTSVTTTYKYDAQNRLLEKTNTNPYLVNRQNSNIRTPFKINITDIERYQYNNMGQITQCFLYFLDPCFGVDGYFTFDYSYEENGLLSSAIAHDMGKKAFSIEWIYEFY